MSIFNIFIDILAFKSTLTLSFVFVLTILRGFFPLSFLTFPWMDYFLPFLFSLLLIWKLYIVYIILVVT